MGNWEIDEEKMDRYYGHPAVKANYYNKINITGQVCSEMKADKVFKKCMIKTRRRSGIEDCFPLLLPTFKFRDFELKEGMAITIEGQIITFNVERNGKRCVDICVICDDESKITDSKYGYNVYSSENEAVLSGKICTIDVLRESPLTHRKICDAKIAVFDPKTLESSYIPIVTWGENAVFMSKCNVGARLTTFGRLQSRKYTKQYENGTSEEKTAIEFSSKFLIIK